MSSIGRLKGIAFSPEAVRGTAETPLATQWLRFGDTVLPQKAEYLMDERGMGNIFQSAGSEIVKAWGETSVETHVTKDTIGWILYALAGQAPVTTGAGPYTHDYTFLVSGTGANTHKSFTASITDPVFGDMQYPGAMINEATLTVSEADNSKFDIGFLSKPFEVPGVALVPSYAVTPDPNYYLPQHISWKWASNVAGLGGAQARTAKDLSVTFGKEANIVWEFGQNVTLPAGSGGKKVLTPLEIYNQALKIGGSITRTLDSTDLFVEAFTHDKIALQISFVEGTNSITITFPCVTMKWSDPSEANNDIRQQTVEFDVHDNGVSTPTIQVVNDIVSY